MATWPTGMRYDWRDFSETPEPVVERSQMERGVPKQRRIASDARVEVQLTLHFDTAAEIAAFETWFYTTIKAGQDFFDWPHPRTGATVQARVVGGELGALTYLRRPLDKAKRSLKIEYWRSTW
ncbi:MAG: hypothetical protein ACR2JA_16580 [Hydrogenophaga sp.]|uniref:hypothetical protein n=1 Tax=Hydrogenophaga sp. TaxID=1904254 RepID=UPI003D9BE912